MWTAVEEYGSWYVAENYDETGTPDRYLEDGLSEDAAKAVAAFLNEYEEFNGEDTEG